MSLDIDSGCKTALKHLRNSFPAIYHISGHFRPFFRNLNFWPKSWFWHFLAFCTMADSMAGTPREWPEMWLGAGNGFSDPSEHLHIPWLTPHNDHIKRNSFLKKIRFLCFSPKMALQAILGEKHKKRIFFKNEFLLMWSLWGVNHGMCGYSEGSEKPFPATNHISDHFRPWNRPWCELSKNHEKCQNHDFGQKFNFPENGRECPEMWYMAGNGFLRCFRAVLHPESISKLI